jgi:uncharacterized protein (DUF362 family)/ferredoxin
MFTNINESYVARCDPQKVKNTVMNLLRQYSSLFPRSHNARILLKPNFNANMNALTGNTTDLRLLSAVIEFLKTKGFSNIAIGEGTNSGYYRNNISVISRLKIDELAKYYGVTVIDLNYSEPVYIDFENGVTAGIAKEVTETDFLINMPKLKTHFEAGMSVCLKNLMGCLIGQENKKKAHRSLARNILHINEHIKPQLHIVDGIIAMEGLGPTRGIPIHTGFIIAGTDPIFIDLLCAKVTLFDYKNVITLKTAEELGLLNKTHHDLLDSVNIGHFQKRFLPPKAGLLAHFIHSPKRQKYFMAVRNTPLFNYLCSTRLVGKLLFKTGLRQDNFIADEMVFKRLYLDKSLCKEGCTKCRDYCPIGLEIPDIFEHKDSACIECLYCFLVCPRHAIRFEGALGFMEEQMRQYDNLVRKIT